ncbi:MAG TPA: hypothetical protein VF974_04750 [Patescibacteria group bacterium]
MSEQEEKFKAFQVELEALIKKHGIGLQPSISLQAYVLPEAQNTEQPVAPTSASPIITP